MGHKQSLQMDSKNNSKEINEMIEGVMSVNKITNIYLSEVNQMFNEVSHFFRQQFVSFSKKINKYQIKIEEEVSRPKRINESLNTLLGVNGQEGIPQILQNSQISQLMSIEDRQKLMIYYDISALNNYYQRQLLKNSNYNQIGLTAEKEEAKNKEYRKQIRESFYNIIKRDKTFVLNRMIKVFRKVMTDTFRKRLFPFPKNTQKTSTAETWGCSYSLQKETIRKTETVLKEDEKDQTNRSKYIFKSKQEIYDYVVKNMQLDEAQYIQQCFQVMMKSLKMIVEFLLSQILDILIPPKYYNNEDLYKELFCGQIVEKILFTPNNKILLMAAIEVQFVETNQQKKLDIHYYDYKLQEYLHSLEKRNCINTFSFENAASCQSMLFGQGNSSNYVNSFINSLNSDVNQANQSTFNFVHNSVSKSNKKISQISPAQKKQPDLCLGVIKETPECAEDKIIYESYFEDEEQKDDNKLPTDEFFSRKQINFEINDNIHRSSHEDLHTNFNQTEESSDSFEIKMDRIVSNLESRDSRIRREKNIRLEEEFSPYRSYLQEKYNKYILNMYELIDECLFEQNIYKKIKKSHKFMDKQLKIFSEQSINFEDSKAFINQKDNSIPLFELLIKSYFNHKEEMRFELYKLVMLLNFLNDESINCKSLGELRAYLRNTILRIVEEDDNNQSIANTLINWD